METAVKVLEAKVVEAGIRARLTAGSAWLDWVRDTQRQQCCDEDAEAIIQAAISGARAAQHAWACDAPDIE